MKICLIAPIPPFRGGISKYCYSLAREIEQRHDLLLLSYRRQYPVLLYGKKSQLDATIKMPDIMEEFKNLSYDIDSASILSWISTAGRIGEFRPELVILPWWVAYWAPMYAYLLHYLKKRNIICLLMCINIFEHEDSFLKKALSKYVIRRADHLIVHSEQELAELRAINRQAVIRKQLLPLFNYDNQPSPRTDQSFRLLFFGFVRPYKGLDILLRAVALLKERDVILTVAGEFWEGKEEYLRLVDELGISGRVEIVDRYVSDGEMGDYFSRADLVVLPYRTSKTSGVIATAYGFGKPVLATDVGGFYEVVVDGYTGRIVPPDDPQSIADGIAWFYRNRQIDFRENIASFVAQRMSWSSLVDTVEEMAIHAR